MTDYRAQLFDEYLRYRMAMPSPYRILEIGPKDGQDSCRLLALKPDCLTMIELPERRASSRLWLTELAKDGYAVNYLSGDIEMFDLAQLDPFDLIWCTGVLYHLREQYLVLCKLYAALNPGGILVLESATIRNPFLRWFNCVQVLYPFSQRVKRWYHLSARVTHLPSKKAIRSWLEMVGFTNIQESACHRKVSWRLAQTRAAWIATK